MSILAKINTFLKKVKGLNKIHYKFYQATVYSPWYQDEKGASCRDTMIYYRQVTFHGPVITCMKTWRYQHIPRGVSEYRMIECLNDLRDIYFKQDYLQKLDFDFQIDWLEVKCDKDVTFVKDFVEEAFGKD